MYKKYLWFILFASMTFFACDPSETIIHPDSDPTDTLSDIIVINDSLYYVAEPSIDVDIDGDSSADIRIKSSFHKSGAISVEPLKDDMMIVLKNSDFYFRVDTISCEFGGKIEEYYSYTTTTKDNPLTNKVINFTHVAVNEGGEYTSFNQVDTIWYAVTNEFNSPCGFISNIYTLGADVGHQGKLLIMMPNGKKYELTCTVSTPYFIVESAKRLN